MLLYCRDRISNNKKNNVNEIGLHFFLHLTYRNRYFISIFHLYLSDFHVSQIRTFKQLPPIIKTDKKTEKTKVGFTLKVKIQNA